MGRLFTSLYYDLLRLIAWGPATDPNKVAPIMAHYIASKDWPRWCRESSHAPHLIKGSFLGDLVNEKQQGTDLIKEVDNIRLQKLTHYKSDAPWNHEFIRADYVHTTTNKNLAVVWERDLTKTTRREEGKRAVKIKFGIPCEPIDRVTYITEKDFEHFVKVKEAYVLRTATFLEPGPTHLQVAAVLETHSLKFPTYHVYSTMCYWYADSTFEVLVDVSDGDVEIKNYDTRKGQFTFKSFKATAYTGITRGKDASSLADDAATNELYVRYLVDLETKLIKKYDPPPKISKRELEQLPEVERESIKKYGWDVSQFLSMVQTMPKHDELLDASKTRAAEVRAQLKDIQSGLEKLEAAERREAEAKQCAEKEKAVAETEAKWKKVNEKLQKQMDKKDEEHRKIVEELQKQMEKRDEELQKTIQELQKKNEELQKQMKKKDEEQPKEDEQQATVVL